MRVSTFVSRPREQSRQKKRLNTEERSNGDERRRAVRRFEPPPLLSEIGFRAA